MRDLLFSVPWYLPTLVGIVGLALWVNGNRRQNPRLRTSGLAVIAVAIGWAVMSYLVDTPREICERQTRQFVQSVVDRNWQTFDSFLEPNITLVLFGATPEPQSREHLSDWVKARAQQIDLKSNESGNTVTTGMTVWSDQGNYGPVNSAWEVDWQESNGKWLVHEIRGLRVGGISSDQVRGNLKLR